MNMQEKAETQCFGLTLSAFRRHNTPLTDWNDANSVLMLSMSIQSDIQEMLERDYSPELIRQNLNLSKYCLSEGMRLMRLREACIKQFAEVK